MAAIPSGTKYVTVTYGRCGEEIVLHTITRETETSVISKGGYEFRKSDGLLLTPRGFVADAETRGRPSIEEDKERVLRSRRASVARNMATSIIYKISWKNIDAVDPVIAAFSAAVAGDEE